MPLVQSLFCLVLIILVLKGHLRRPTHRLFALFLLGLFAWGLVIFAMRSSPDTARALFWERWLPPVGIIMAVAFFHFTLRYTSTQARSWVLPFLYLLFLINIPLSATSLVFPEMQLKSYGYAPVLGVLSPIHIAVSYILPIAALLILRRHYQLSYSAEERNRSLYIIAGLLLSLVGGVFDLLPLLGLSLYPGFIIGNMLFCCLTAIAILKYNLLDIHLIWRRSQVYFLASLVSFLPFGGLFYILLHFFRAQELALWQGVALGLLMTLGAIPLWKYLQGRIDRWFFRDKYHYLEALERFSREIYPLPDLARLHSSLVTLLGKALKSQSVVLLQPVSSEGDFIPVAYSGKTGGDMVLKNRGPLVQWLERYPTPLLVRDIDFITQLKGIAWAEKNYLEKQEADLLAPLKTAVGELSGVIVIGPKLTGQPYSLEDLQLIRTFGHQLALALENSRLYSKLINTRDKLETWLNSMADCILVVGADHTVQFMNQTARMIFSAPDQRCWEILRQSGPCPDCPLKTPESEKTEDSFRTLRIEKRDFEVTTSWVREADNNLSMIEILRDVTERNRLQQALIEAKAQTEAARSSEQLKNELLSMVSHELRTPLTLIKGYTGLLLSSNRFDQEELKKALLTLDREADKLTRLVADLLDMSHIEAGNLKLQMDDYPVSEIIESVEKALSLVAREHQLEVQIPEDLPPVRADRVRIGQVLINLCDNAAKYSAPGSRIAIEACPAEEQVIISVLDQGEGISGEANNQIFNRFYHTKSPPTQRGGLGLGLAICRGIIAAHGGKIWVQSARGAGAKFSFSLPVVKEES
jgi:signal transduction histidine kinase